MQPHDRINLDISYADFEYAITACLERCNDEAACERLIPEIIRVMKIRIKKEQKYRNKVKSMNHARIYRHL